MQTWASMEGWILTHPTYDTNLKTCTCTGYPDSNPKDVQSTDKTPVWIAPGDLVALYRDDFTRHHADFAKAYAARFLPNDHVKVCLTQEKLLQLWNGEHDGDHTPHCHVKRPMCATAAIKAGEQICDAETEALDASGNEVVKILTGWDGSLFCACGCWCIPIFCGFWTNVNCCNNNGACC